MEHFLDVFMALQKSESGVLRRRIAARVVYPFPKLMFFGHHIADQVGGSGFSPTNRGAILPLEVG